MSKKETVSITVSAEFTEGQPEIEFKVDPCKMEGLSDVGLALRKCMLTFIMRSVHELYAILEEKNAELAKAEKED